MPAGIGGDTENETVVRRRKVQRERAYNGCFKGSEG